MDNLEQKKRLLDTLIRKIDYIGIRPQLYVGSDDPDRVEAYLSGFMTACNTFGLHYNENTLEAVLSERGWKLLGPYSLVSLLREQGLATNEDLNKELVAIEIEILKCTLNTP